MNGYVKTALLMAALTALFLAVGYLLAGGTGSMIALAIAVAMNFFAWWNSDKLVLRLYNARPVDARAHPELQEMLVELCRKADLPVPALFIIDEDQPNAFATGRNPNKAAVAVTTGLLRRLSREEIAAVIAHELAHIKNYDTLIMTVTATFAGAMSMLANFAMLFGAGRNRNANPIAVLLMIILAPLAAALVQMAISRAREYEADRVGGEIVGNPLWLASALRTIDSAAQRIDNLKAEQNPQTAHMFIVNPLHAYKRDRLFSTHPSTENRIKALEEQAAKMGLLARPQRHASAAWPKRQPGPWG